VRLKHVLERVPRLGHALRDSKSTILSGTTQIFNSPDVQGTLKIIAQCIAPETQWRKGVLQRQVEELFAVNPGIDGGLDALRALFEQTMELIEEMRENLQDECEQAHGSTWKCMIKFILCCS